MSAKPPRIQVWLKQKLAILEPTLRVLTQQPWYQKAAAMGREQWGQHRRRTLAWGAILLVALVAWVGWGIWQKMPKAPPPIPVTLLTAEPTNMPNVIEVMAQAARLN